MMSSYSDGAVKPCVVKVASAVIWKRHYLTSWKWDSRVLPTGAFKELTIDFQRHTGWEQQPPEWTVHPFTDFSLLVLLRLTSSFEAVKTTTATRGRSPTTNANMRCDKLLSFSTCLFFWLGRTEIEIKIIQMHTYIRLHIYYCFVSSGETLH